MYSSESIAAAEQSDVAIKLAGAQQIKDITTIVFMNLMLLVPIAWPGLVLFGFRWALLKKATSSARAAVLWSCTFVHEVLCFILFASSSASDETIGLLPNYYYAWGYAIGIGLSAIALLELMYRSSAAK
ncbi:hypothetical protein HMJ29_02605 [Hymenobacter taeanensis]|uniref:Uncharacterized protein n=1 Tax=Hymenobacter taeanensis TaxID=2735321 RepID=A0A6M6BFF5_9BACT|nr:MULTISPECIES: hypothetical protein [Hymenobacter]QJX45885.1 hypothetical protein HMJ29_02605 [Hymenobacter taeanensis]UOQ79731.1 hypothetical protein MUN83_12820 [Hymenobacter sp. 5414T-23]